MDELLGTRAQPERWSRSGSLCAEVGTGRAVLTHAPFLAPALFLRCASDSFSLTPNTLAQSSCQRRYAPRLFGFIPECRSAFLSETAFGFAGILT